MADGWEDVGVVALGGLQRLAAIIAHGREGAAAGKQHGTLGPGQLGGGTLHVCEGTGGGKQAEGPGGGQVWHERTGFGARLPACTAHSMQPVVVPVAASW